jgi:HipA-like kinase
LRVTPCLTSMAAMKLAVEHVRRMRGGAQAQLMRCDDEAYYIVKFQNNPQHLRILANEMLATRLAARLGLIVPQVEVVDVRPEIIAYTPDLVMQLGLGRKPCAAGKQFGSQFPGHPARMTVHDFLPDEQLGAVRNLSDFLGVLVFDKWTCNTNGRQAIFFREPGDPADAERAAGPRTPESATANDPSPGHAAGSDTAYTAMMIDFGFCFNAGEWDFPDAPLRGLYARHRVYEGVAGMEAFEPWLARLEKQITERVLGEEAAQIPPEWYGGDWNALERLIERLYRRRERVRELIVSARDSGREPFPNWKVKHA